MTFISRSALLLALILAGCASTPVATTPAPPAPATAPEQTAPATVPETAPQPAETPASPEPVRDPAADEGGSKDKDKSNEVPVTDKAGAKKALAALDDADIIARGKASYYHLRFNGRRTASGQRYDDAALTAAHRSLPFGTRVLVTSARNGRSVVVTINDRGPFLKSRVIDLSGAAARALGLMHHGIGEVVLSKP